VVDRVVDEAPGLTTGQLRSRLRRACIEIGPEEATARYQDGVTDRRIVTEPGPDGTGSLFASGLEPHRLAAGMRRVNRIAKSRRSKSEIRTMDQLRADVFLDLLTGTTPPGDAAAEPRGTVDIRVGLTTLIGHDEHPADLGGFGPIVADVARSIVSTHADLQWRTIVVCGAGDETTALPCRGAYKSPGGFVPDNASRARPNAAQRRTVEAMYPTCVWPGCRMPARESDLDHRRPRAARGPTTTDNLTPRCRHHHRIRHRWGWSYRRLADGSHEFTSPLGRLYRVNRASP
jgi:hypothetical protein